MPLMVILPIQNPTASIAKTQNIRNANPVMGITPPNNVILITSFLIIARKCKKYPERKRQILYNTTNCKANIVIVYEEKHLFQMFFFYFMPFATNKLLRSLYIYTASGNPCGVSLSVPNLFFDFLNGTLFHFTFFCNPEVVSVILHLFQFRHF